MRILLFLLAFASPVFAQQTQLIEISWTYDQPAVETWEVERRDAESGPYIRIALMAGDTTSYTDAVLDGGAYAYRVRACFSDSSCSPYSNTVAVVILSGDTCDPCPPCEPCPTVTCQKVAGKCVTQ